MELHHSCFQHSLYLVSDGIPPGFRYTLGSQFHIFPRLGEDVVLYQIGVTRFSGEYFLVLVDQLRQLMPLGWAQLFP